MDLHVTDKIILERDSHEWPNMKPLIVDPYDQASIDAMFLPSVSLPFALPSLTRALLCTREFIGRDVILESGVGGQVELRSTMARLGFSAPPTWADPGFEGQLTFEVSNVSKHSIVIHPGMAMWSLIRVPTIGEPMYKGRYQGQTGIQTPKALAPENPQA